MYDTNNGGRVSNVDGVMKGTLKNQDEWSKERFNSSKLVGCSLMEEEEGEEGGLFLFLSWPKIGPQKKLKYFINTGIWKMYIKNYNLFNYAILLSYCLYMCHFKIGVNWRNMSVDYNIINISL